MDFPFPHEREDDLYLAGHAMESRIRCETVIFRVSAKSPAETLHLIVSKSLVLVDSNPLCEVVFTTPSGRSEVWRPALIRVEHAAGQGNGVMRCALFRSEEQRVAGVSALSIVTECQFLTDRTGASIPLVAGVELFSLSSKK